MITLSILCLLFSNAVTLRRDMSILFNRIAIIALIYCFLHEIVSLSLINKGIGMHGGLLHVTNITQIFHIFVFLVCILILQLTSFFPRKVWVKEHSSLNDLLFNNFIFYRTKIINKMGEHLKIIEYPKSSHIRFSSFSNQITLPFNVLFNSPRFGGPKLITSFSLYTTLVNNKYSIRRQSADEDGKNININPWSLTGFVDGDGSFSISITKSKNDNLICKVQPVFTIGLHIKDLPFLLSIKKYFKDIGNIYTSGNRDIVYYNVSSVKEIMEHIIPHFDSFPLVTQKQADYILYKEIVSRMANKEHLTNSGLIKILSLRASLNLGLKEWVADLIKDIEVAPRPKVPALENLQPNWLSGFVSAEGCFSIGLSKNVKLKTGYRAGIRFILTQHNRDIVLINQIRDFFGSGRVISSNRTNSVELWIIDFEAIKLKIVPFFDKFPLIGAKGLEYNDFKKVLDIMDNKLHLTKKGCEEIRMIKENMNTKRNDE